MGKDKKNTFTQQLSIVGVSLVTIQVCGMSIRPHELAIQTLTDKSYPFLFPHLVSLWFHRGILWIEYLAVFLATYGYLVPCASSSAVVNKYFSVGLPFKCWERWKYFCALESYSFTTCHTTQTSSAICYLPGQNVGTSRCRRYDMCRKSCNIL